MKSNKDQSTKQRAAGPEKSQDRPTHTELKTLKEDNVTTKAEQQQSSSSSKDIDGNNVRAQQDLVAELKSRIG